MREADARDGDELLALGVLRCSLSGADDVSGLLDPPSLSVCELAERREFVSWRQRLVHLVSELARVSGQGAGLAK
eukprot:1176964-Prorocentrum_minimum.AAC.5